MRNSNDDAEALASSIAAGRRRQALFLGAGAALAALGVGAAVWLGKPSACDALADALCALGGVSNCTPLRSRLSEASAETCQSTLGAMEAVPDKSMKMAIATQAMEELLPETAAMNKALRALPVDRRAAVMERLNKAPAEERAGLIEELIATGDLEGR